MIKTHRLTDEQFERLTRLPGWETRAIPADAVAQVPAIQRTRDTISVLIGEISDGVLVDGVQAVLGETEPRELVPGEAEPLRPRSWRFIIEHLDDPCCPYLMHGPFPEA